MFKVYACPSDLRKMLFTLRRSKVRVFALCRYVVLIFRIVDYLGWDYYVCVYPLCGLLAVPTNLYTVGNLPSSSVFLRRTMRRTMCTSLTSFVSLVQSRAWPCTLLDSQYIITSPSFSPSKLTLRVRLHKRI